MAHGSTLKSNTSSILKLLSQFELCLTIRLIIFFKKIIIYFAMIRFITKENLITTYNFAYFSKYSK
jgi:hypothetical protein